MPLLPLRTAAAGIGSRSDHPERSFQSGGLTIRCKLSNHPDDDTERERHVRRLCALVKEAKSLGVRKIKLDVAGLSELRDPHGWTRVLVNGLVKIFLSLGVQRTLTHPHTQRTHTRLPQLSVSILQINMHKRTRTQAHAPITASAPASPASSLGGAAPRRRPWRAAGARPARRASGAC